MKLFFYALMFFFFIGCNNTDALTEKHYVYFKSERDSLLHTLNRVDSCINLIAHNDSMRTYVFMNNVDNLKIMFDDLKIKLQIYDSVANDVFINKLYYQDMYRKSGGIGPSMDLLIHKHK